MALCFRFAQIFITFVETNIVLADGNRNPTLPADTYRQLKIMENLPKDPMMLMSFINMKLRDEYPSLDELCASLSVDRATLEATLATAGFEYNPTQNKFW